MPTSRPTFRFNKQSSCDMTGHVCITLLVVAMLITVSDGQPDLTNWSLDLDNNNIMLYFAGLNPSNNGMPIDCSAILIGSISGDINMATRLLPSVIGLQVNDTMVTCDLGMRFRHILDYVLNSSDYYLYYNSSGMTEYLIQDSHGMVYENRMGMLAAKVVLDSNSPALISFELLDLNEAELVLSFSQPINVTTLNFAYLSLLSSPFNEVITVAVSLSDGNCTDGCEIGRHITLSLEFSDLDRLKLQSYLCTNVSNCYLYYTGTFVKDFGGNSIAEHNYFTGYLPQNLTLDTTGPSLTACNLDLTLDQLSLEFDEPIDASSFIPAGVNISTTNHSVFLTSASIVKSPNGSVIVINLGLDTDNIKTSLSEENDNISVSVMSFAFKDIGGNSIHSDSLLCTFDNDTIMPNVSFHVLDLNSNILQVIFDEPVLMESINISGFKLTDAMGITTVSLSDSTLLNISLFNDCNGLYATNELRTIYLLLKNTSLTAVKTYNRFGNTTYFTFLLIDDDSVFDLSGNGIVSTGSIAAADVIADNSPAALVNFSLDMNIGRFVLTFSDVVDVSTLQIYEMSIQPAPYDTGSTSTSKHTPNGVFSNMDSSIFQSDFTNPGLVQLKYKLLKYKLATDITSTYLIMSAGAFNDIRGVDIIAITNGNGLIASTYIRDTTPPVLISFDLNMYSGGYISFTFDEPINRDRFNFTLFSIQADSVNITNTSTNLTIDVTCPCSGSSSSSSSTKFGYTLTDDFQRLLLEDPSVAINSSTTNLVIMQGGAFDASGNPINTTGPVGVNTYTPRRPASVRFGTYGGQVGRAYVHEHSRQQRIPLRLSYSLPVAINVQVNNTDGTASDSDYVSGPYTATFLARSRSTSFYINITDDNIVETTEYFELYIDSLTLPSGTTADSSRFRVNIYNNDNAIVNFIHPSNSPTYNVIEGNRMVQFMLNLTNPLSRDTNITVISTDGLATRDIDYNFGPYIVTFIAGDTTASLNISITDDDVLENNENFFLTINRHNYPSSRVTVNTTDRPIVNIIDDDFSTVEFNQSIYRVNEDDGSIQIFLVLSNPSSFAITADVLSTSDSATDIDYDSGPYTVSFAAGITDTSFNILITDDSILEGNETFYLTIDPSSLRDDTNVDVGSLFQVRVIIVEDDFVIVNFDQSTYTIDEDDGPLQPVLVLSNPSTYLINVQVNSTDGSAIGGGVDYFSGPYLVAFPPGMTAAVISVQINDDALYENNFLIFTLTIISDDLNNNVIIGETNQTTVTIIDDESKAGTISFIQSIYRITENSGSVEIQLNLNANSSNFTVQVLSVSRSASGDDYEPGPYTVAFPAEITTAFLNISITDDEFFESNETFDLIIDLSSLPPNVTIGAGQATVIILNDDELRMQRTTPYIVNFDQSMYSIDESSGQVLITVFLDEPPSTDITVVVFTTDGSATGNGHDYNSGRYDITFNVGVDSVSFHIPIIDDHIFEQDELFILGLCSLPNNVIVGNFSQATVTIVNDDINGTSIMISTVEFIQSTYRVNEDDGSIQIFLVLSNPSSFVITADVLSTSDSATGADIDYNSGPYTVSFAAGITDTSFSVLITDDSILEGNETFYLTIDPSSLRDDTNVDVGSLFQVTMIIVEDDFVTVNFDQSTYNIDENGGSLQPVLVLSNPSTYLIIAQVNSTDGSAVGGGVDYFSGPYLVAFPPGMTTSVISVQINDDTLYESNSQNFTLTITSGGLNNNVIIGETNQTTVTIIENDSKAVMISFNQSIYNITENSGSVEIQLICSDSNSSNFTIQVLSVGVSATGEDYEPGPYTVAFPAGITSAYLNISITNDEMFEGNETFDLALNLSSLPPNVTVGDIGRATVLIINDDELPIQRTIPYIVNFDQSIYSIDESSGQVLITVILDEPPSTAITVVVFTTDGSATGNGQDYNSGQYNVTFSVGVFNASFGIPIIDDHIFEQDELFILGLYSLPNDVIVGNYSLATVTIVNDDASFIAKFSASEYEIDFDIYSPIGTVVLEALFIINSNVTIEYLSFDITMDEMVGGSNVHEDFLINGTIPPLVQQTPFQSMYLLTITTGNVLDTANTMDITFSLFAFINTSTGVLAMPVSNVILHKIVPATPVVCNTTTPNDTTPTTVVTHVASLYFSESTYNINENAGYLQPVLILTAPSSTTFTIQVLSTTSDPAIGDDDYDSGPYTVTFPNGVTNVSFDIIMSDNNQPESDKTFYLIINSFSLPHNITITDPGQAIVIVLDDDSIPDCSRENDSTFWQIEWNTTKAGDTAKQNCPDSSEHYAQRNCHLNGSWDTMINVTECQSAGLGMLNKRIEDLLNSTVVNITDLSTISRDLSIITNTSGVTAITPEDLNTTNSILSSLISIINNASKENTTSDIDNETLLTAVESASTTIDNLLSDSNRESYQQSNIMELPVAEDLLRNAENFNIAFGNVVHMNYANNSVESNEYNMIIQRDNIIFNAQNPELITEYVMFGFNNTNITIPASTIRNIKGERVPIVSFICKNLLSYLNNTFESDDGEEYTGLRSGVIISSQISNGSRTFLGNNSVILNFVHNSERATSTQCVFWDFNLTYTDNEAMGGWSDEGIIQDSDPSSPVMCNSTHLTSFAVLVSAEGGDNFQSIIGLKAVSYIGCAISIVCLLLTIIAIILFKKSVFKDKIYMVHLNLAIALLFALIVFVSGVETAKNHRVSCILVTSILHYLFLAVFSWALCEGISIYMWFVAIFYKGVFQQLRFFLLLGWGLPIPIAVVSAAVSYNNYEIKNDSGETIACWISDKDGAIWAFIGPMIAMICINTCFLIISLVRIYLQQRNFSGNLNIQNMGTARTLIVITLALQPLLCGTWILGLFFLITLSDENSDPELSEALSWIFTLVNSLQGFLIFYFYIVRKKGKKIINEIQEIYRRQRKIKKFEISGKKRNANADKSGTLLSYFSSTFPRHTEFETSADVKKSTIIETHNSDHDLVAPIVQHSFDEHESGIKENVTEPNSQEQELKVLNENTPETENKMVTEPSGNKLRAPKADRQSSMAVPYYTGTSFTSGYNQVKAYIIIQSPMTDTVKNFWKMIIKTRCSTIIMLCDFVEDNQEVCCCYWPWQGGTNVYGEIEVKYFGGGAQNYYTASYMEVTDTRTRKSHRVTQFQFHDWLNDSLPNSDTTAGLMSMITDIQKVQYMYNTSNDPITVHCSPTLDRSSTFCAIFTALKELRASQSTDVFQLVKSFYTKNPGVTYNAELHQFASQAIQQHYMRSHKTSVV